MIYITQLIFLKKGKEATFHEFENFAIPLMEKYTGKMLYRIRPTDDTFITSEGKQPYEVHFLTFDSDEKLGQFMKDDNRLNFIHLKDESIESVLLVKGEKM